MFSKFKQWLNQCREDFNKGYKEVNDRYNLKSNLECDRKISLEVIEELDFKKMYM